MGATGSIPFSPRSKAEISKIMQDKYSEVLTTQNQKDDALLFEVLKDTFVNSTNQMIEKKAANNKPGAYSEPPTSTPLKSLSELSVPNTNNTNTNKTNTDLLKSSTNKVKDDKDERELPSPTHISFGVNGYGFGGGDDDEQPYEFQFARSFKFQPRSDSPFLSKIEGPGKLLRAQTSSQLLSMVNDSVMDDKGRIDQFINQLKNGEVQVKGKTDFRQRRLTYSQQTMDAPESTIQPPGSNNSGKSPGTLGKMKSLRARTSIFASSEIGMMQESKAPFPDEFLGTYSCHGIEPAPDDEDGIHEKINQDRGCIVYPYHNSKEEALFIVLDGHGEQGDKVSEFVMRQIIVSLEKDPLLDTDPIQALKNAYITTNTALMVTDVNFMTSGCTCVTVYVKGNTMYVANVGDSRAVMAKKAVAEDGTERLVAHALTRDHKPDDPDERARIESWGGFVCPPHEEGLSSRVYLDAEFTMIGLAMSRSIGDHAVKNVGVIAEPEVVVYEITDDDQFMVMASDGVWEFISNEEAVKILDSCMNEGFHASCQELIETAAARWQDEEGDYRDDITAVVVRFPLPYNLYALRSFIGSPVLDR